MAEDELAKRIDLLSPRQRARIERIVNALNQPISLTTYDSDVVTPTVGTILGETIQLHHLSSAEPFTKDRFEYALVAALKDDGHTAQLASKGNPGHDLTVDDERWSLKTQADTNIKPERLHISKFMELGKGQWETEQDLLGLRQRMFKHMEAYHRIFSLRCLTPRSTTGEWQYELVEIPKALLLLSEHSACVMKHDSKQIPKPGVCEVRSGNDVLLELYFDGGTERKLQVRKLRKASCILHATWTFTVEA